MSVASEYTPVQTAGNGSLTAFAFGFPIFDTSDLKVYLKTVATAVKTLLVETTNYTVSATNNDYTNGGTVTTVSTYSNLYEIIIERDIPYTQPTDLEQAGRIPSETLDDTHDRALMQIQQVNNKIQRALVMPVSDDSDLDMELPNEIERASQFLAFSAAGAPVAANSFDGVVTASAYIQTLLVAADAEAAKDTLDLTDTLDAYYKGQGAGVLSIFEKLALRDTGIKIGNGTRSTSGDEVITGVGFQPSIVLFFAGDATASQGNISWGFDDGTVKMCWAMYDDFTQQALRTAESTYVRRTSVNRIESVISALGADGFTLTWTLTGTIDAVYLYLALP